jgi:hypothetical protein
MDSSSLVGQVVVAEHGPYGLKRPLHRARLRLRSHSTSSSSAVSWLMAVVPLEDTVALYPRLCFLCWCSAPRACLRFGCSDGCTHNGCNDGGLGVSAGRSASSGGIAAASLPSPVVAALLARSRCLHALVLSCCRSQAHNLFFGQPVHLRDLRSRAIRRCMHQG